MRIEFVDRLDAEREAALLIELVRPRERLVLRKQDLELPEITGRSSLGDAPLLFDQQMYHEAGLVDPAHAVEPFVLELGPTVRNDGT